MLRREGFRDNRKVFTGSMESRAGHGACNQWNIVPES